MKRIFKFWPLLSFLMITAFAIHVNYGYIGKHYYPLQYPFMNEIERTEYFNNRPNILIPMDAEDVG